MKFPKERSLFCVINDIEEGNPITWEEAKRFRKWEKEERYGITPFSQIIISSDKEPKFKESDLRYQRMLLEIAEAIKSKT